MTDKQSTTKKEEFLEIFVKNGDKILDDEDIDDIFLEKNIIEVIPFKCEFLNNKQNAQKNEESKKQKNTEQQENSQNEEKEEDQKNVDKQMNQVNNEQESKVKEQKQIEHKGIVFINTKEQLFNMIKQILKNAHKQCQNVIGVDTEQSFQTTYTPFLSLIQISTYDTNYVIDCLSLDKQWIQYLKYIFQNRNIVKVFYAGQNDLVWLKRDYNLQVFNFCDVKVLADFVWRNKNNSLVSILEEICDFQISQEQKKKLQLSQWETRPLTQEQLEYAALDAHYLIYIRFYLLKELLETDGIDFVVDELFEMQNTILKEYQQKEFSEKQYLALCFKLIKQNKPYQTLPAQILGEGKIFTIELAKFRDQLCKELNLNVEKQLNDSQMMAIVQNLFFQEKNNEKAIIEFEKTRNTIESVEFFKKYEKDILALKDAIQNTEKEKYAKMLQKLDKKEKSLRKNQESELQKMQKKEKNQKISAVKTEPYQNCQLQAPSGLVLCNCNKKKIEWYKNNGLGEIVSENPLTLRLNFQPNGQTNDQLKMEVDAEDGYYTTHRENQCVVCGDKENFVKFHIVPPLYRTHFPNEFKSHRSHDILLLCLRCHQICSQQWDLKKKQIAERYNIELHSINKESSIIKKIQYVSTTAKAYQQFKEKMIKKPPQCEKNSHGKQVISQMDSTQLIEFIKEWRQYFLDSMNPRFLPPAWNVNHKFQRGFGNHSVFNEKYDEQINTNKKNENDQQNGKITLMSQQEDTSKPISQELLQYFKEQYEVLQKIEEPDFSTDDNEQIQQNLISYINNVSQLISQIRANLYQNAEKFDIENILNKEIYQTVINQEQNNKKEELSQQELNEESKVNYSQKIESEMLKKNLIQLEKEFSQLSKENTQIMDQFFVIKTELVGKNEYKPILYLEIFELNKIIINTTFSLMISDLQQDQYGFQACQQTLKEILKSYKEGKQDIPQNLKNFLIENAEIYLREKFLKIYDTFINFVTSEHFIDIFDQCEIKEREINIFSLRRFFFKMLRDWICFEKLLGEKLEKTDHIFSHQIEYEQLRDLTKNIVRGFVRNYSKAREIVLEDVNLFQEKASKLKISNKYIIIGYLREISSRLYRLLEKYLRETGIVSNYDKYIKIYTKFIILQFEYYNFVYEEVQGIEEQERLEQEKKYSQLIEEKLRELTDDPNKAKLREVGRNDGHTGLLVTVRKEIKVPIQLSEEEIKLRKKNKGKIDPNEKDYEIKIEETFHILHKNDEGRLILVNTEFISDRWAFFQKDNKRISISEENQEGSLWEQYKEEGDSGKGNFISNVIENRKMQEDVLEADNKQQRRFNLNAATNMGQSFGYCLANINKYPNTQEFLKDFGKTAAINGGIIAAFAVVPVLNTLLIAGGLGYATIKLIKNDTADTKTKWKKTGKFLAQTGTGLGTTIGGAAIGQALIPVPVLGAFIGGVIGGLVGSTATQKLTTALEKGKTEKIVNKLITLQKQDGSWEYSENLREIYGIKDKFLRNSIPEEFLQQYTPQQIQEDLPLKHWTTAITYGFISLFEGNKEDKERRKVKEDLLKERKQKIKDAEKLAKKNDFNQEQKDALIEQINQEIDVMEDEKLNNDKNDVPWPKPIQISQDYIVEQCIDTVLQCEKMEETVFKILKEA
ncbi:Ribonuclease H-like domain [Pseudocohnilembus persalinus]|uniref:Ribonuclease H-like domain n=1 Tax=Pseudocohnilembus persalinus TaxID=266149 RepID=A0A0V0QR86_PSEPJ|nr:Ribonuclease H-like domain [Pseudocohnilembus persalinus]|eukprot:KRX04485.1 Ribonuclease H-like domain [Pseudocohnilembus persalinus]